ncbi:dTMP kinase [Sporolactobacillus sp. Y61]|jgi:dTMP kinase|uniref:Thymidylate kinase n=1 Tax=Sporolactobacillus sp. Y61 TaxID=3160863 RepID=A0AAU8IGQ3_9BACL|nr:dTMP kinase [Sporolactobacillus sp. THM19-2]RYL89807.1 dTMP kinase [Sporolactobacillus sp. THM19-2]
MSRDKGLFITFEGPDGAGKTTQIHKLARMLETQGVSFVLTREPGGTAIGDEIRSMILDPAHQALTDRTEILLYAASRSQHVEEKIIPALKSGQVVLSDRFVDASIAYQAYGLGQPVKWVREVNRFATGGLTPDRTYLIDVSPEAGRKRMKQRSGAPETGATQRADELDRVERRSLAYHQRVREGFQKILQENEQRICRINGEQAANEVFHEIWEDFRSLWTQFKKTD